MKIKHIVALILVFSLSTISVGCNNYSDDSYNMVEKQQFALNYFKALGKQEDTIVSPLLAMITIGELSGIVDDCVMDKSVALLDSKKVIYALNIDCGRLLSEIKVADSSNTTNVTEYNESTEDSNSADNFDYSSNFLIKLEEIEKTDGFGSVYTSNLSNLYRGRINSYYTKEQYNTIIEEIDAFTEWHQYSETDISLFNKLTYKNENIQDDKILTPCNIETVSGKEVKGVISRDIISCNRTDKSLSCKVSSGDTEVSLVLMMPLDESTSLDEYIDSMTQDEFRGLLYGYGHEPWCKDKDGYNFNCAFPEITDSSIIKDNSTYDKMGLGELFSTKLKLEGSQGDKKLHSIIQYTGIEVKAPSKSNNNNDYNENATMVFNRPFVYALIEDESNYPLIMGRVDNI